MEKQLSDLLGVSVDRCKVALLRNDSDLVKATDYLLIHESEPDLFWFERWDVCDSADTLEDKLSEIIAADVLWTDSSFPPSDESLFFDPVASRTQWRCHDCNKVNPMPPDTAQTIGNNLLAYISQTNFQMYQTLVRYPKMASEMVSKLVAERNPPCMHCGGVFPISVQAALPAKWVRPSEVKDDVSVVYGSGAPWVLIRGSVCGDDVRQGAVGNCWFVGALSILAHQRPLLVSKLFPIHESNGVGAWLINLCKDGIWRSVLIDDFLPVLANGTLAYTTAARRQLWVPLLEKAAAKLCTCYQGMQSGTICEAFSLLTGFATDRVLLRTKDQDIDVLWARLLSALAGGYLIGLACAGQSPEETRKLHDLGLQAPHAYIMLNAIESEHRLVFLANPWGERSPNTWTGKFANNSLEIAAQKVPKRDSESKGQFWIEFSDLLANFASIEFCRTDPDHLVYEERLRGWLTGETGLGDAFIIQTGQNASLADISVYQESHAVRESATNSGSMNLDLGFVIHGPETTYVPRQALPERSTEVFLEKNSKYFIVPVCFGNALFGEHRRVSVCVRTVHPVNLERISSSGSVIARAINACCVTGKEIFPGCVYYLIKDNAGAIVCVENQTTCMYMQVTVDAEDSVNLQSSRGLITRDTISPKTKQIIMVLTARAQTYTMSVTVAASRHIEAEDDHVPAIDENTPILSIHTPVLATKILTFNEIVKKTTDANGTAIVMQLLFKQEEERRRLFREYTAAGIDNADAQNIANEEVSKLYD